MTPLTALKVVQDILNEEGSYYESRVDRAGQVIDEMLSEAKQEALPLSRIDESKLWRSVKPNGPGVWLECLDVFHFHSPSRMIIVEYFGSNTLVWKRGTDSAFCGRVDELSGMYYLGPLSEPPTQCLR